MTDEITNYVVNDITFVIIGRNEGKILDRVFESVKRITENVIFVDSNSTDNSVEIAKTHEIKTIIGHNRNDGTASFARNLGANLAETRLIHFLDGDETICDLWVTSALKFLNENPNVSIVHGYKRVYTKNFEDYFILKDKKNWQPDYLQGACLLIRQDYLNVGGYDDRLFGEEERDLYVKIHSLGKKNWYIDTLMASHYDFKKRTIYQMLTSKNNAGKIVPLLNAIRNKNLISYLFVYRRLMTCLLLELLPFMILYYNSKRFFISVIVCQVLLYFYVALINRRGYFIFWKQFIFRLDQLFPILSKKFSHEYVRYK